LGASGPVRRDEFNEFVRDLAHWRGEVDEWRRAHDEDEKAVETRERRRWSWPEIAVAVITASGVVVAATITALSR
jgi:hypothetical protein